MTAFIVEICVKGPTDMLWANWLDDVEIIPLGTGEFILRSICVDHPALYGLLSRVHDGNLFLVSLHIKPMK